MISVLDAYSDLYYRHMNTLALLLIFGGILVLAFEVWIFVDLLQNPRLTSEAKVLWAVLMFLIHPIVAIVYYFTYRPTLPQL